MIEQTYKPKEKYFGNCKASEGGMPLKFAYTCKYATVNDIIKQFDKDDKIMPYLKTLKQYEDYFRYADTIIVIDNVPFLYAENTDPNKQFVKLVSVISANSDDLDEETIECILV